MRRNEGCCARSVKPECPDIGLPAGSVLATSGELAELQVQGNLSRSSEIRSSWSLEGGRERPGDGWPVALG